MKALVILLSGIFLLQPITAQNKMPGVFAVIDAKALMLPDSLSKTTAQIADYINASFTTPDEKARAIFVWLATNIAYDAENMFAINLYETPEEKITKPLYTRKGTCDNYAALFRDICTKSGIRSYVVEGSTRQNGFVNYIAHAWCAALIDSTWYMFDPTWGAGYTSKGKFYKKFDEQYFKVAPAVFIKTHMPFDYLWQFLNYPLSPAAFYEWNNRLTDTLPFFNYRDSIAVYEKQDRIARLAAATYRIEKTAVKNTLVFNRLQYYKIEIENDRQLKIAELYNGAVTVYNEAIRKYNLFTHYQNKMFIPLKPDAEIKMMVDSARDLLLAARGKLTQLKNTGERIDELALQLNRSIDDVMVIVNEQYAWLAQYFGKAKAKRRVMFYEKRITRFDIPAKKM
jgi:Transglutaminase-like superfamily